MPDYKFEYLVETSPYYLDELSLVEDRHNHEFYIMGIDEPARGADFRRDSIVFRVSTKATLHDNLQDYLADAFLQNFNPSAGTIDNRLRVVDSHMAFTVENPCIWAETEGEPVTIPTPGKDIQVPEHLHIYERIPFDHVINTMNELERQLQIITKSDTVGQIELLPE